MQKRFFLSLLAATSLLLPSSASAAEGKLLELINEYRANPPVCESEQSEPLPPLAPEAALTRIDINSGGLQEAMHAVGFQASRAQVLTITGPSDARGVLLFASQHHCSLLLSERFSVVGVSRDGEDWNVVFAQPRVSPDLGDWEEAGREILKLVNAARAEARSCGDERYEPAPGLRWSARLGSAALKHSRDMAEHSYFSHAGRKGRTAETRVTEEGYTWRRVGENVAAGQGSPRQVVDGWLSSPGHCTNIMSGNFTEMGAAYATNPESGATIYWTQVFATPR